MAIVPVLVLVGWFFYLWSVSGVLTSTEKYPKGAVKSEGYLKRTTGGEYKRHGQWVTYHENGKIASRGRYELGKKTGEWKYWDQEGRPTTSPPE